MKILLFALAAVAFYLAWPVSLWLGTAVLILYGLRAWVEREQQGTSTLRRTLSAELQDVCLWVTIAIAVVATVQVLLQLIGWAVPDHWVLWTEVYLSELRDRLTFLLSLPVQVFVWSGLLLLSVLTGIGAVTRYAAVRAAAARSMVVLNVACSFTFFSLHAVGHGQPQWIAKWAERAEVRAELDRLDKRHKEVIALAWISDQIHGPTPDPSARAALTVLLTDVQSKEDARNRGTLLASVIPQFVVGQSTARAGLLSDWASAKSEQKPTLRHAAELKSEAHEANKSLKQTQTAVMEVVKAAVGDTVGGSLKNAIVRSFLEAFAETVVEQKMRGVVPKAWIEAARLRFTGSTTWWNTQIRAGRTRAIPALSQTVDYERVQQGCCIEVTTVNGVPTSTRRVCGSQCKDAVGQMP